VRRATDAASRGRGRRRGAAGKAREMGRLTAEDEAPWTNDAWGRATWGGERERYMRRGGEGDEQGTTRAMTGGSHQGGDGSCNRPCTPRMGNAGGGGSRLGRVGRAGPRQPAGPRESEGGGAGRARWVTCQLAQDGVGHAGGKRGGGSRPRLGQKERGRDFPFSIFFLFSYYPIYP
jgi:hypothetical protein